MALSRRTACSKLLNAIYPARPTQVVARPYRLLDRKLHTTARCSTDGVFRALTESRIETPWIEALRKKQHEDLDPSKPSGKPESPTNRNLEPKKMSDSYHSVVLPLGRDPWLLDTYLNSSGHIRLGAIFMDLDALSGIIAYKHTGDGVTTVTAACDRIIINHPLTEICDLELSGQVTYATGRSSMEISLQAAKAPPEGQRPKNEDVLLTCTFTMVSLDPGTKKPVPINPVKVETEEERQLFEQGEANSKHRKELSQTSLMKHTPNDEESDLIHAMWQRQLHYHDPNDSLRKPNNVHFMDATRLQTASIMQPQYRNRHSFMIFGGFLLKQTFELAFCCVASFAHTRPTFVSLDPSTFQNPVPVGSVLYLTATVTYTDPPLVSGKGDETDSGSKYTRIQVRVDSKVRNVEHGETKPTGQFNYTFTVDKDIKVMPRTYSEFMMYIDARRRARRVTASIKKGEPGTGQPSDPDLFMLLHTPTCQRRVAGALMLARGTALADQLFLPIWVESSVVAHQLYLQHGFLDVENCRFITERWDASYHLMRRPARGEEGVRSLRRSGLLAKFDLARSDDQQPQLAVNGPKKPRSSEAKRAR